MHPLNRPSQVECAGEVQRPTPNSEDSSTSAPPECYESSTPAHSRVWETAGRQLREPKKVKLPSPLISTEWLVRHLGDARLRVYDTTVFLTVRPEGGGYDLESGRARWAARHIPGAGFLDLIEGLSDTTSDLPFMMPSAASFATTAAGYGIDNDCAVVLYTAGAPMWASRAWWMLRSIGFDNAGVLDGGWDQWLREGRPTNDEVVRYPQGQLTAMPRPELWADKDEMLRTLDGGGVCTINALSPSVYSGEVNTYGRAGHIPASHNVFYSDLIDAGSGTFLPAAALKRRFAACGAFQKPRVITYCGGGISATIDALALHLAGHPNIAVYDGSLSEWARDPALPLKTGSMP